LSAVLQVHYCSAPLAAPPLATMRPLPAEVRSLPVAAQLESVVDALRRAGATVLEAPPGAGKSTGVPLALLGAEWLGRERILMLEPRRLAARAIASRMASLLGEPVGRTVGYRTRLDTRVSRETRLEVVTEGVLTSMLQSDPALEGVGVVIFDEFHERSLNADLGLALTLDARANLRPGLRLLVMSATLEIAPVATLLGDVPVISSSGRAWPVETRYVPPPRGQGMGLERHVARVVLDALDGDPGDVLAFLPGAPEIRRVQRELERRALPPGVSVHPLFGDLPVAAQDAALAAAADGRRKVVLATSIAETSLTIEGVRIVVDSGLSRAARFDPVTGMSALATTRVSRAAADQRRGRAGRLAPGICYRLWSESSERSMATSVPAEILHADLASLALELAAWGVTDAASLRFLDFPPAAHLDQARSLLAQLGAIDAAGRITPHGRRMQGLGAHPRLSHMLLAADALGLGELACDLAAVLSERDLMRGPEARRDADIRSRAELLHRQGTPAQDAAVDASSRARAVRTARRWRGELGLGAAARVDTSASGLLLAHAYPDRVGMRRPDGRYLLSGGRGAFFADVQSLSQAPFIVAAELDAGEREARIFLAAPVRREEIEQALGERILEEEIVRWDAAEQAVLARRERRLGALLLEERRLESPDAGLVHTAVLSGIRQLGLDALPWSRAASSLRERAEFLRRHLHAQDPDWPPCDDATLHSTLDQWLGPWLTGVTRRAHLARLDLHAALAARFDHVQRQEIERLAPTHVVAPSGSRIPVDYSDPEAPVAAVRLQEVFGLTETPRLAGGRVPLTLSLLSPGRRPVQVTRDLASFWSRGYAEVRKELKGRYPKHYWPEDPLTATPTNRVRPR
jgi:ATP-dependent helicase HrpB